MLNTPYTLYMSHRSPFARRVRILLEELGLDYRAEIVDVLNPPAWLRDVNPLGRVPALRLPTGQVLIDSWEQVAYFRERFGTHELFQRHGADEVRLRNVTALSVGVMEHAVLAFLETTRGPGRMLPEWRDDAVQAVEAGLAALERELGSGPYVAGSKLTFADLELGVAIQYCDVRLSASLVDRYPRLRELVARLGARRSFQATVPPA